MKIKCFLIADEPELYEKFLQLSYEVFISEQGWNIPCDHEKKILNPSKADQNCFLAVIIKEDEVIAGIKGSLPRQELSSLGCYENFLSVQEVEAYKESTNCLSTVSVKSEYRNKRYTIDCIKQSLAFHMSHAAIEYSKQLESELVLASTGVVEGAFLISSFGFYLVEPPQEDSLPYKNVIQMALPTKQQIDLVDFLAKKQEDIIKEQDFKSYILQRLPRIKDMDIQSISPSSD